MTVKDLTERLSECDPLLEVFWFDEGMDQYLPVGDPTLERARGRYSDPVLDGKFIVIQPGLMPYDVYSEAEQ